MSTYSFMEVAATLVGPTGEVDLGYGAGVAEEGIDVDPSAQTNTMTVGADGEGMHSLHADKSGTVTVRLLKTSDTNARLQAMYDAQRLTPSLWGKNVIVVRMPNVGDIHTARSCAFQRNPKKVYKKVGDFIEWVFDAVKIDSILGKY